MKHIEQIYDWLEAYSFSELSEEQQATVLQEMTEDEYNEMRSTLGSTKSYFTKVDAKKTKLPKRSHILSYKIELYKIAIAACFIISLQLVLNYTNGEAPIQRLAYTDTVYVDRIDTVVEYIYDTVERTNEIIVFKNKAEAASSNLNYEIAETPSNPTDCEKQICPSDLSEIKAKPNKNSLAADEALKEFVVMLE